ncbi:hypothetical protein B0H11DRAFT_2205138 [Mycena galericulata]|nr:hypothetical protein B0H11DRAFT_2205138 [Mycena galericulata]
MAGPTQAQGVGRVGSGLGLGLSPTRHITSGGRDERTRTSKSPPSTPLPKRRHTMRTDTAITETPISRTSLRMASTPERDEIARYMSEGIQQSLREFHRQCFERTPAAPGQSGFHRCRLREPVRDMERALDAAREGNVRLIRRKQALSVTYSQLLFAIGVTKPDQTLIEYQSGTDQVLIWADQKTGVSVKLDFSDNTTKISIDFEGRELGGTYNVEIQFRDPWEVMKRWLRDATLAPVSTWFSQERYLCMERKVDFSNPLYEEPCTGTTWGVVDDCRMLFPSTRSIRHVMFRVTSGSTKVLFPPRSKCIHFCCADAGSNPRHGMGQGTGVQRSSASY